MFQLPLDHFRR